MNDIINNVNFTRNLIKMYKYYFLIPTELCFFMILFIYSWETQREREEKTQKEGEASSCREPKLGLDPGSPGSHPELKSALNRWATWAASHWTSVQIKIVSYTEKSTLQNFSATIPWPHFTKLNNNNRWTTNSPRYLTGNILKSQIIHIK